MEIIKELKIKGEPVKMWRGTGADGRKTYICTSADNMYLPEYGNTYTQKDAIEIYKMNMERSVE
jgi:hypothetical protein